MKLSPKLQSGGMFLVPLAGTIFLASTPSSTHFGGAGVPQDTESNLFSLDHLLIPSAMDEMISIALFGVLLLCTFLLLTRGAPSADRLPPGSMGLPVVGQSLGLLRAMRANAGDEWLASRIRRYGPVSKLRLFGTPTVFVAGRAANKFVFANEAGALALQQPPSMTKILGRRNLLELVGEDHARVRGALALFLKPDMLKGYVAKMDGEVRRHLERHWEGRHMVKVLPLMKNLTFDIICSLLFGLERGTRREALLQSFTAMLDGVWSVPVDLPFTPFRRSLKASRRAKELISDIAGEKKNALERGLCSPRQDLITYLLSTGTESSSKALTMEEVVDNALLVMIAGHDTSSILITFLVRHLTRDPATYSAVLQEQEEIARSKAPGEALTWDDLCRMKCTWRVAMEVLRTVPPVFGNFRKVLQDVEFSGYRIPRGWQVFWATNITHMDDAIFPEPRKFDPSRFENQSSIPPYCFVAFGGGARICPGNEFARLETLVAMHHLVTRFRWKLCGGDDSFRRDPLPSPAQGLPIQIEHRRS